MNKIVKQIYYTPNLDDQSKDFLKKKNDWMRWGKIAKMHSSISQAFHSVLKIEKVNGFFQPQMLKSAFFGKN